MSAALSRSPTTTAATLSRPQIELRALTTPRCRICSPEERRRYPRPEPLTQSPPQPPERAQALRHGAPLSPLCPYPLKPFVSPPTSFATHASSRHATRPQCGPRATAPTPYVCLTLASRSSTRKKAGCLRYRVARATSVAMSATTPVRGPNSRAAIPRLTHRRGLLVV